MMEFFVTKTLSAFVDDEDFDRVCEHQWKAIGRDGKAIHTNNHKNRKSKSISLSNIIMGTRGLMYDHKDRNPLNFSKENLRVA